MDLDRTAWLKAGAVFIVSVGVATGLGVVFSAFAPPPSCDFPVVLERSAGEETMRATVAELDGLYPVGAVGYRLVRMDVAPERILEEGSLETALDGSSQVAYHPVDPAASLLQVGDYFEAEVQGETHLMLLEEGIPIGWTQGCET